MVGSRGVLHQYSHGRSGRTQRPLVWALRALLASVLLLSALPCVAAAQARAKKVDAQETPAYRDAIARGIEEYSLGNYAEARDQFAKAHAIWTNARTFRGLGFAEFELRNYVESVNYLEQALASREKPLEGGLLQETQALLARARDYVGTLVLRVTPSSAALVIDGITRLTQLPDTLRLNVGDHVLEFQADGYVAQRRALKVKGGQQELLELELPAFRAEVVAVTRPAHEPAAPAGDPVRSERTPVYKKWWLWTSVAVVLAGGAVGTALAIRAKRDEQEVAAPSANTPAGVSLQPLVRY